MLITGCKPVTEPHAGEAVVAEQYGHALSRAAAGDDDLGVVHPLDEGQALPGRFREPIGLLNRPAAAEEAIDAGTLSLQLCAAGRVGRHGTDDRSRLPVRGQAAGQLRLPVPLTCLCLARGHRHEPLASADRAC